MGGDVGNEDAVLMGQARLPAAGLGVGGLRASKEAIQGERPRVVHGCGLILEGLGTLVTHCRQNLTDFCLCLKTKVPYLKDTELSSPTTCMQIHWYMHVTHAEASVLPYFRQSSFEKSGHNDFCAKN